MKSGRYGQTFLAMAAILEILWTVCLSEETISAESTACKVKEIEVRLSSAIEYANEAMESLKGIKFENCPPKPDDCKALLDCGKKSNGIYTLWPKNRIMENGFHAYCDMENDGGGWTVIQRRGNYGRAIDYFYQNWTAYKEGFGNPSEDFWIGNDILYAISNQKKYSIRFNLEDSENNGRWATYDHFWIESEEHGYTLHVSGYKGTAGDSFSTHSGHKFSTQDRDNDSVGANCAVTCRGAWWYRGCYRSTLNGMYLNGYNPDNQHQGIHWGSWKHYNYSLAYTEMKIKPLPSVE